MTFPSRIPSVGDPPSELSIAVAACGKRPRNHSGIEPVADFRFPDFWRDHPFAIRPASLAPARPIVDRPRIGIVQRLEPALAMLLNKEPDLFDGSPDFGRFRAAAPSDQLRESPSRRFARLARLPRDKPQRRRQ